MADTSGSRSSEKRDVHLPPPKTKERRGDNESHAVIFHGGGWSRRCRDYFVSSCSDLSGRDFLNADHQCSKKDSQEYL